MNMPGTTAEGIEQQTQLADRAALIIDVSSPEPMKVGRCVGFDRRQVFERGAPVLGVALADRAGKRTGPVAIAGHAFVQSGDVFDAGDALAVDWSGRAVRATELAVLGRPVDADVSDPGTELPARGIYAEHVFARAILPSRNPGSMVWVRLGR